MKRRTAKLWIFLLGVLAIILASVFAARGRETMIAVVMFVYLIVAFVLKMFTGCRHCGYIPRRDSWWHTHCPRCGEPYDE